MKGVNRAGNLKRITTHARRTTRRKEAQARQAKYNLLTPAEVLANLDDKQLIATKQRAKLAKLLVK